MSLQLETCWTTMHTEQLAQTSGLEHANLKYIPEMSTGNESQSYIFSLVDLLTVIIQCVELEIYIKHYLSNDI